MLIYRFLIVFLNPESAQLFMDRYFFGKTGSRLSQKDDIKALYNKYKSYSTGNRPMRGEYSYGNEAEFFADMVSYYYYKKFRTDVAHPRGGFVTDEIINIIDKYIKIAKNGYK